MRLIVWICAGLLLMNMLLLILLGVGSMYAFAKVEQLSNNINTITNKVEGFGNIQLLPTNVLVLLWRDNTIYILKILLRLSSKF